MLLLYENSVCGYGSPIGEPPPISPRLHRIPTDAIVLRTLCAIVFQAKYYILQLTNLEDDEIIQNHGQLVV